MRDKLRRGEKCPIHGGYFCCGRKQPFHKHKALRPWRSGFDKVKRQPAVGMIEDPHHPRGYREICNTGELRRRKLTKLREQKGVCALGKLCIFGGQFESYADAELDHIEPKGHGGGFRDDHMDNLQVIHKLENRLKGSRRIYGNRDTGTDGAADAAPGEDQSFADEPAQDI